MAAENLPAQLSAAERRLQELPVLAQKHANKLKWVGGAIACVVIAPFVLMGIGGLIGGIAFVAIGYTASEFAPVFAKRVANAKAEAMEREINRHIMALKAEAQKNPVPTLWNKWNDDGQVLNRRRDSIVTLEGQRRTFKTKLDGMKQRFGPDVAQLARFEERVNRMGEVIVARKDQLNTMQELHAKKKTAIELAEGIWELTLASKEFDQADPRTPQQIFEAEFKEKTAFDAIELEWNTVGAKFDQMAEEELAAFRPSKTLGFNPSDTIDVVATTVQQPVIVNTISSEATSRRQQ